MGFNSGFKGLTCVLFGSIIIVYLAKFQFYKVTKFMISNFRRDVDGICSVLGYYAA